MKNTLFIFGAGASHDAVNSQLTPNEANWQPPMANGLLGSDLFERVARIDKEDARSSYDTLSGLLQTARRLASIPNGKNFEDFLLEVSHSSKKNKISLIQLITLRFYLYSLFKKCSLKYFRNGGNYANLIQRLINISEDETEIIFSTFNYDSLLEKALIENRIAKEQYSIGNYINWRIPLIKFHGSIDWVYRIYTRTDNRPTNKLYVSDWIADNYEILEKVINENQINMAPEELTWEEPILIPTIAIPVSGKSNFECPKGHLDFLISKLPNIENIVVIGWRGMDKHLLNLLKQNMINKVHLIVVSKEIDNAEEIARELADYIPSHKITYLGGGFSKFIDHYDDDKKLNDLLNQ